MSFALAVYGVLVLSKINTIASVIALVSLIVICILSVITAGETWHYAFDSDEKTANKNRFRKNAIHYIKRLAVVAIVSAALVVIIPKKEEMYIIASVYMSHEVTTTIIESPEAAEIGALALAKLRDILKVESEKE